MTKRLRWFDEQAHELYGLYVGVDGVTSATNDVLNDSNSQDGSQLTQKSSSTIDSTSESGLIQVIQNLNLLPSEKGTKITENLLQMAQAERTSRSWDHERSTVAAMTQNLAKALGEADEEIRQLLNRVYVHSEFNSLRSSSLSQQQQLNELEKDVEKVGKDIASMNSAPAPGSTAAKEDFVTKWS